MRRLLLQKWLDLTWSTEDHVYGSGQYSLGDDLGERDIVLYCPGATTNSSCEICLIGQSIGFSIWEAAKLQIAKHPDTTQTSPSQTLMHCDFLTIESAKQTADQSVHCYISSQSDTTQSVKRADQIRRAVFHRPNITTVIWPASQMSFYSVP